MNFSYKFPNLRKIFLGGGGGSEGVREAGGEGPRVLE